MYHGIAAPNARRSGAERCPLSARARDAVDTVCNVTTYVLYVLYVLYVSTVCMCRGATSRRRRKRQERRNHPASRRRMRTRRGGYIQLSRPHYTHTIHTHVDCAETGSVRPSVASRPVTSRHVTSGAHPYLDMHQGAIQAAGQGESQPPRNSVSPVRTGKMVGVVCAYLHAY